MEKKVRVLSLSFDDDITYREVPLLRGAIISCVGRESDVLFHNHFDDARYRYSYPLIQYKRIKKKASVVCINEGANTISRFISQPCESLYLGERRVDIKKYNITQSYTFLNTDTEMHGYKIHSWLPLNEENHKKYRSMSDLADIIRMLEQILKGNILSMCKGLGFYLEHELLVSFTEISDPQIVRIKGIPHLVFDVEFDANILLPEYIGVGRNVSIGYGTVTKK